MMKWFDYIYYRFTKFYFRGDGRNGIRGILAVSMIQGLTIATIIAVIIRSFYGRQQTAPYSKELTWVSVIIVIGIGIYNYKKYHGSYHAFNKKWKDEPKSKQIIKGLLVLLTMILAWVPTILIGLYW